MSIRVLSEEKSGFKQPPITGYSQDTQHMRTVPGYYLATETETRFTPADRPEYGVDPEAARQLGLGIVTVYLAEGASYEDQVPRNLVFTETLTSEVSR